MKIDQKKLLSVFEIFLMVSLTIASAYFINENSASINNLVSSKSSSKIDNFISSAMVSIGKIIFGEKGLVSAESTTSTCLKNKNGSICQEYNSDECESQCASPDLCIASRSESISECKKGTCYDKSEGTCSTQSPKQACEIKNGTWFSDPNANVAECQRGCCLIGDNALFTTQQKCIRQSNLLGIDRLFKPEVKDEISCYLLSRVQEEGACVFESEFEKTCKFTTKSDCSRLKGDFNSGFLCSAKSLGTNCESQATVGCVDGKDEIYWFDSCGNRENIYDSNNKVRSWNAGKILSKNESCSLGTSSDPFAYQETCGNCFYLTGSRCGIKTASESLADPTKNVVCRDLTCVDDNGKKRQNGESWCAYDSSIGTDTGSAGLLRSTDTPGSEHFRKVCKDGEIITEPCAGYRNQICVESKTPLDNGKEYSSAACKINTWQNCLAYNQDKETLAEECSKNVDCFMKDVKIADKFSFSMCAPKYPPGFLFNTQSLGKDICNYASQKCTVIYVKNLDGWACKANCDCENAGFTEQMNDLCMSLGDCGASANYNGDLSTSYKVSGAPELSKSYLEGIKKYSNPVPGKVAEPGNFSGSIPGILDSKNPDENGGGKGGLDMMNMALGAGGLVLRMLGTKLAGGFAGMMSTQGTTAVASAAGVKMVSPAMAGLTNALKAAGAVVAVAAILYQIYGFIASGDYMMAGVVAVVAVASFVVLKMMGMTLMGAAPIVGIVVMVVVMLLQFVFGLGETKQVIVEFTCKPWQPPVGGAKCGECGKNGLPCTKYSCSALGQACELINEGTGAEACVNINPNDVISPVISPLNSALKEGYNYQDVSDNGFKVKSNDSTGCLSTYTPVTVGINLNEYAYCKVDSNHTDSFDEMSEDFGDSYYLKTHNLTISMPSLESLGLPGYDPTRQADYNLYVRCQDKNGNSNIKEYDINFCVKPGIDITPPIVTSRLPYYLYSAFEATKMNASVYTNEPSECKYDSVDNEYDFMRNQMNCSNDLLQQESSGWRCDAEVDVPANDSVYYIRCKDQPWLIPSSDGISPAKIVVDKGQNEDGSRIIQEIEVPANRTRNSMSSSYQYSIKKSKSALNIDSITPSSGSEIKSGVEPVSVTVEVKTSGGADGNAECKYKSGDVYIDFFNTLSRTHTQVFQTMSAGEKIVKIRCADLAGNVAEGSTTFIVSIDSDAPVATRVFKQESSMNLITNENSVCYFVTDSTLGCGFEITDANSMSGDKLVHTTDVSKGGTYYIKCKDSYGKSSGDCTIVVRGVDLR